MCLNLQFKTLHQLERPVKLRLFCTTLIILFPLKLNHCIFYLAVAVHWSIKNLYTMLERIIWGEATDNKKLKKHKKREEIQFLFVMNRKLKMTEVISEVDKVLIKVIESIKIPLNRFALLKAFGCKSASSWVTNGIKNDFVKHNKLSKKWLKEPTDANKERFVEMKKIVTKLIPQTKKE